MLWIGTMSVTVNAAEPQQTAIAQAQHLNVQGLRQLEMGQVETALATWRQAEAAYTAAGDETGKLGSQLNQVQALQQLGQYRRAKDLLEQMNRRLISWPDSLLKASHLQSLGVALYRLGDIKASYMTLKSSLQLSQQLDGNLSTTLIALGNVVRVQQKQLNSSSLNNSNFSSRYLSHADSNYIKRPVPSRIENISEINFLNASASVFYQQAAKLTTDPLIQLQANLNLLSLLIETRQRTQILPLLVDIQSLLQALPPSRAKIYAQVNLAESLIQLEQVTQAQSRVTETFPTLQPEMTTAVSPMKPTAIAQLLANVVQQARSLSDRRAEAYALGQLGHLYEITQRWVEAEQLTRQALQIAQAIQADDVAVSWQWQLGRIFKQQGRQTEAIAVYNQAVATLSVLRGDLVAINPEGQFSFREQVEPIYRQLVQLLLENPTQVNLKQARSVIEALQLAELNNFFREACLDAKPQQIDQLDPQAAVIYSIILPDRLALILALPNQPLRYHATRFAASAAETTSAGISNLVVESVFEDLLATLNPFIASSNPLQANQQLYDWLIRPLKADLAQSQVKTLVFVLDGVLQGLPLAALHDGQQYLIEQYSVALTPGLQLLPPRSLPSSQFRTLAGGVSEARQGFSALPGVARELQAIAEIVPTSMLLNQSFNQPQLVNKLDADAFPIVHLATHGQFSSQADQTFLLTWDGRLNVQDLDQLLEITTTSQKSRRSREPIELLILSACQTAMGDKRAALGLAGVAVRSGARSTIATLWSVQDDSTADLIAQFYAALKQPGITRAEALRQAQLSVLRSPNYQHPYYWAPFVLVGNWQ